MEIAGLDDVDWSAQWFAPIAQTGRTISLSQDWRDVLNRTADARDVRSGYSHRIWFGASNAAGDEPYEAFIARTGCVPTRANLHDFFNAAIWLQFPALKAQLNRLQSDAIARESVHAARGPLRDALTLVDENAMLLVTQRAEIVSSLRDHDWTALFDVERTAWNADITVVAFGHALLQKLVRPYKAITAHALHVPLASDSALDQIDRYLAATFDNRLSTRDLMPLPVLGIPGWCAQNQDPCFYLDAAVFRPVKMRRPSIVEKAIE